MNENVPIKRMNSWRLGSTVKYYIEPQSEADLIQSLDHTQSTKHGFIFLGLGSNILFPDHQLDATLVRMRQLSGMSLYDDEIEAQAGLTLAKLGKKCVKLGMSDAAFLVGIPGMVGGALVMNAGAQGHAIWDYVLSVRVLTPSGIQTLYPKDFDIGYRHINSKHNKIICFISVRLKFQRACVQAADKMMRTLLKKRNAVQPIGTYNCGCVFKNLPQQSIGVLLDQLGFRGYHIGGARVSPIHANFIENHQLQATSAQVLALIYEIQAAVYQAVGITPELEVKIYD
ncbi:UDP-N-acetylmuramate dehydrogenase [Gammaproteobacteria bacterium]|nr:UDP-N-acetylmuramate dehydrogenase [Gammaproteobacteria bacterium]